MPLTVGQSSRLAQSVRVVSVALSIASVVALCALGWYERRETLQGSRARLELMARVLEDHATRNVESAEVILRTMGDALSLQHRTDPGQLQPLLSQALLAQPTLRGIAVLDLQGQVLASSDPREQGLRLNLSRLGKLPQAEQSLLLPLLPGRNLRTLGDPALRQAVAMLPLMRRTPGPSGRDVLLLALINPDALANYQQATLLANAIKFSPEGGQIELAAQYTDQNEIHISVSDRGPAYLRRRSTRSSKLSSSPATRRTALAERVSALRSVARSSRFMVAASTPRTVWVAEHASTCSCRHGNLARRRR